MNCGKCRACCQWGSMVEILKPKDDFIKADVNGNCIHLGKTGCAIHDTAHYPEVCKNFSCVDILATVKDEPFIRIIIAGARQQLMQKVEANEKSNRIHTLS